MKRKLPSLNALKAFEALAHTGSFTAAADQLQVTQSAVSRQVKHLEDALGVDLVERHHHNLAMTDAGRSLVPVLKQSFDKIDMAVRGITEQKHLNKLYINVPITFGARWLMPRLHKLAALYPDLELAITTNVKDNLSSSSELDFSIRLGDGQWPDLDSEMFMQERHILICSPALLARKPELKDSLDGATLLHVLKDGKTPYETWKHWLAAAHMPVPENATNIMLDTLSNLIQCAITGLGVAVADRNMVTQELAEGSLVQLMDTQLSGSLSYWFTCRSGQASMPHIQLFKHWLMQEIKEDQKVLELT